MLSGTVLVEAKGATGVYVVLQKTGEPDGVGRALKNGDGAFEFRRIKPGTYDLVLEARGREYFRVDGLRLEKGNEIRLHIVHHIVICM